MGSETANTARAMVETLQGWLEKAKDLPDGERPQDVIDMAASPTARLLECEMEDYLFVPIDGLNSLANTASALANALNGVVNGPPQVRLAGAPQRRQLGEAIGPYQIACNQALGFLLFHGRGLAAATDAIQLARNEFEAKLVSARRLLAEAEARLADVKTYALDEEVKAAANRMDATRKSHRATAYGWLGFLSLAVVGTAVKVICLLQNGVETADYGTAFTPAVLMFFAERALLVSLLWFAIAVAVRAYRSHLHLAVVSEFKRDALSTFGHFAQNASDVETKRAVLLETTRAIFTPLGADYLSMPNDAPNVGSIIEAVKRGQSH